MKRNLKKLANCYQMALQTYLKDGHAAGLKAAVEVGSQALYAGISAKDLALLNEQTLAAALLSGGSARNRATLIKQAGAFLVLAIIPKVKGDQSPQTTTAYLQKVVSTLSQRTVDLAASNAELNKEIAQRKTAEKNLKKSQCHSEQLLAQSDLLQVQLRRLSRQVLSVQEEERKRISRELHDVVAQTLTGINIRLATLKKKVTASEPKQIARKIANVQRIVEKSVEVVHRFALELRPAVLDDLGLIPALVSFLKQFMARTGIRTRLTAFGGVEQLDISRRTVFFRVAQETLANVAKHAHASFVDVSIQQITDGISMRITDDGKSFEVERVLLAKGSKRLGILGMRERLEMVGGSFSVESTLGSGTTIMAKLPNQKFASVKPMTGRRKPLTVRTKKS